MITETGDITRQTTLTYDHFLSPTFIVGLPAATHVTLNSGPDTSSSWVHDTATGFINSATAGGITTAYQKDALGNVSRVTRGNTKFVSYTYSWGQVQDIITAEHTTSRNVNSNGTVASDTQAGRTTSYQYDKLGRLTLMQPPGGANPIVTEYDNEHGAWIRNTRGASITTTALDAFGRPISTTDSYGIRTRTRYNPEGRTTFEAYPVNAADMDIGTTIEYDKLGRVTRLVNPDNSARVRTYGPGTVTVTDEKGHGIVQTFAAFGHPDDARLELLRDADNHLWDYVYDTRGRLAAVTAEDGISRTWTYYDNGLVQTEAVAAVVAGDRL